MLFARCALRFLSLKNEIEKKTFPHDELYTISCLLYIFRLIRFYVPYEDQFQKGNYRIQYYSQTDKRWRKAAFRNSTIEHQGCGPAVLAMVHSAIDKNIELVHIAERIEASPCWIMTVAIQSMFENVSADAGFQPNCTHYPVYALLAAGRHKTAFQVDLPPSSRSVIFLMEQGALSR